MRRADDVAAGAGAGATSGCGNLLQGCGMYNNVDALA